MNARGTLASNLMSPLTKITNLENTTQFKILKNRNSDRVNDLLIRSTLSITLHDNLFTFCDTGKMFELKGDLLKIITKKTVK